MEDSRLTWLQDRVTTLLGEKDPEPFQELLTREDGRVKSRLQEFLTRNTAPLDSVEDALVFFYKTLQEKIIEHEIVVAKKASATRFSPSTFEEKAVTSEDDEEQDDSDDDLGGSPSPPLPPAPPPSAAKSKKGAGAKKGRGSIQRGSTASESAKGSKRSSLVADKGGKRGRKSPSTVVETLTDLEDQTASKEDEISDQKEEDSSPEPSSYVTRVDQEVVMVPVLHCTFGKLNESEQKLPDTNFVMMLRHRERGITKVTSVEEAEVVMPEALIMGSFVGPTLLNLQALLERIFVHALSKTPRPSTSFEQDEKVASRSSSLSVTEKPRRVTSVDLLQQITCLTQRVLEYEQTQQAYSLSTEIINALERIEAGEPATQFENAIQQQTTTWVTQLRAALDEIINKQPEGEDPSAEVEHWERKEVALSGLHWQLQEPPVRRFLELTATITDVEQFRELESEVRGLLVEARTITRSLDSVSEYFRELSEAEGCSLVGARRLLVRLMTGLRILWSTCTAYARDERMEGLLARLAWLLCHKVAERLRMDIFFKQGAEKALQKAKQGAKLLKSWKGLYFETRQVIEESGNTPRWEFDGRRLFGHSEYIREVCVDLQEVCQALIHFRSVLIPELEEVLLNPIGVEVFLNRITKLLSPIQEEADFEVFVAGNGDSWRSFITHFRRDVMVLEQDLAEYFRTNLVSGNVTTSRDVLSLLRIYAAATTRPRIRAVLSSKYELVAAQFLEEVRLAHTEFQTYKENPPIKTDYPSTAGAILWSREIFSKLKNAVVVFQQVPQLQACVQISEAFHAYVQLTRQMKQCEDERFKKWLETTEELIKSTMNSTLVKIVKKPPRRSVSAAERRLGSMTLPDPRGDRNSSESTHIRLRPVLASLRWVARAIAAKKRALSIGSESSFVLPHIGIEDTDASVLSLGLQYQVQMDQRLLSALDEVEQLEDLGLEVGDLVKKQALSAPQLKDTVIKLTATILRLNMLLAPLSEAEVMLLQGALKKMERIIEPGVNRLRWNSRSLPEYCSMCHRAVTLLSSSISQLQLCAKDAKLEIEALKQVNLFHIPCEQELDTALPWLEHFRLVETRRAESIEKMLRGSEKLKSILLRLEHWLDNTHTGALECMTKYYEYWELQLRDALLSVTKQNLQQLLRLLQDSTACLQLDADLDGTELILRPSPVEAYQSLLSSVSDLMLILKLFPRWVNGTCLPTVPDLEDPRWEGRVETGIVTFLEEIAKDQKVKELTEAIKIAAQVALVAARNELYQWSQFRVLWIHDKEKTCELFAESGPSLVDYDEKLVWFTEVRQELDNTPPYRDVRCVRLHLQPLLNCLRNHTEDWKRSLARGVLLEASERMWEFIWSTGELQAELEQPVEEGDVETLRVVMETITRIRLKNTASELRARQVEECFRTITLYDIEVDEAELRLSKDLFPMWDLLYLTSLCRAEKLKPLREALAKKTLEVTAEFAKQCEDLKKRFTTEGPGCVNGDLDRGLSIINDFERDIISLEDRGKILREDEILLDIPLVDHSQLTQVRSQIEILKPIYNLYSALKDAKNTWAKTLWSDIKPGNLDAGMADFVSRYESLSSDVRAEQVAQTLSQEMCDFQHTASLLEALKSDDMRERHWMHLMQVTNTKFTLCPDTFVIQNLLDMELPKHETEVLRVVLSSKHEVRLETALEEIRTTWANQELPLSPHRKTNNVENVLLGSVELVMTLLTSHFSQLKLILVSKYVGPFLDAVKKWDEKLSHAEGVLETFTYAQERWLQIREIMKTSDIVKQLPQEVVQQYEVCERAFHVIMTEVIKNPLVLKVCNNEVVLDHLRTFTVTLEQCEVTLVLVLDAKRDVCPRLYFLSDQELLALLGGKFPDGFVFHVGKMKLIPHINEVEFIEGPTGLPFISAMSSSEGERLLLKTPVNTAYSQTESWLQELVLALRISMKDYTKQAVRELETADNIASWILSNSCPGMACLAALRVEWTRRVDSCLSEGSLQNLKLYHQEITDQINGIIDCISSTSTTSQCHRITSILILLLRLKDILLHLIIENVTNTSHFLWDTQLRFYWDTHADTLSIKQSCSELEFGYEFNGVAPSLIPTDISDRITLIITQMVNMRHGIMFSGSSGTGKTEIFRDVAKVLGRLSTITMCTPDLNWQGISRTLESWTQTGMWGCFEQLNRLEPSALSVFSTQLQIVQEALIMALPSFTFNGREIGLDLRFAVFASVNPELGGRHNLPPTVTALFRPASCTKPDMNRICFVLLLTLGFHNAEVFAKKIVGLCQSCKEHCSKQPHYDFEVNQMKMIIKSAARIKSSSQNLQESEIIVSAIEQSVTPKLVPKDLKTFKALIRDIFPGVEKPSTAETTFEITIKAILKQNSYWESEHQIDNILKLKEVLDISSKVIIVGASGGGKSVTIQMYLEALKQQGIACKSFVLCPKSCPGTEFFGTVDKTSNNWRDGIFTNCFRSINEKDNNDVNFIILDGHIDPVWSENLNSVLDENRMLSLANGDMIPLKENCKIIFETGCLNCFTPALLSRVNVIFVDRNKMDPEAIFSRWLKLKNFEDIIFNELYKRYIPELLKYFSASRSVTILPTTLINMINQLTCMLDVTLPPEVKSCSELCLEAFFIQAIYFSLGAKLLTEYRSEFDQKVKKITKWELIIDSQNSPAKAGQLPKDSLFHYVWEDKWICWQWRIPEYKPENGKSLSEVLVPTIYTEQSLWLLNKFKERSFGDLVFQKIHSPLVFAGTTGTSKSTAIKYYIKNLNCQNHDCIRLVLSSCTPAAKIQSFLNSVMIKRTKRVLEPPNGKKLVVFIDDLDMPMADKYGMREPLDLLRFIFEHGSLYTADLSWKQLSNIGFIGAISVGNVPTSQMDPRFLAKLCLIHVPCPEDENLQQVFTQILKGHLKNCQNALLDLGATLTTASLHLYKLLKLRLPPTPSRWMSHFTVRDLTKLYDGFCKISPKQYSTPESLVRLWRHEICRIFKDRLENIEDQNVVDVAVQETTKLYFRDIYSQVMREPILYGDFRNALNEKERIYEDLLDYEAVYFLFQEVIEHWNRQDETHKLEVVLFDSALEHLVRLHRILRTYRGHGALVGGPGIGRKTMTKLAMHAANCTPAYLPNSSDMNDIIDSLITIYRDMGIGNKNIALLIGDADLNRQGIPEILHQMLTTGWLPDVFNTALREEILQIISEEEENKTADREELWQRFQRNCVKNLHVILSVSKDTLRKISKTYSCFLTAVSIDWYRPWPNIALEKISKEIIGANLLIPSKFRKSIQNFSTWLHYSASECYESWMATNLKIPNSPRYYLDFIRAFASLLERNYVCHTKENQELSLGIEKLNKLDKLLKNLRKQLEENEDTLSQRINENENLINQIATELSSTEILRENVRQKVTTTERQELLLSIEEGQIENEMIAVQNELKEQKTIIENIEESELQPFGSIEEPTEDVLAISISISLLLFQQKEPTWTQLQTWLMDLSVIKNLADIESESISYTTLRIIRTKLKKVLKQEEIFTSIPVCWKIFHFLKAVQNFCVMLREMHPRLGLIKNMAEELNQAKTTLQSMESELEIKEGEIKKLVDTRELITHELAERNGVVETMKIQLEAAEELYSEIQFNKISWSSKIEENESSLSRLPGDCLLTAAIVSYLGPISSVVARKNELQKWIDRLVELGVPFSQPLDIERLLALCLDDCSWKYSLLNEDVITAQNVLMMVIAVRFPYCIDPQQQAIEWLKRSNKSLLITSLNDPLMMDVIRNGIIEGSSVLLEDVGSQLESSLYQLLDKVILETEENLCYINFDGQKIQYNPNFRLFLSTKDGSPSLESHVYAKTSVVDFTISVEALEQTLLRDVAAVEDPTLSVNVRQSLESLNNARSHLNALRKKLLQKLTSASNESLLLERGLHKDLLEIQSDIKNAEDTLQKLKEEHKKALESLRRFELPAERAALLYSVLADLAHLAPTYQFSLTNFRRLVRDAVKQAKQFRPENESRISAIADIITRNTYSFICRGLFAEHQMSFTLTMLLRTQFRQGLISSSEMETFHILAGTTGRGNNACEHLSKLDTSPSKTDKDFALILSQYLPETFGNLKEDMESFEMQNWRKVQCPEHKPIPCGYEARLNTFQRVILLCCVRRDRIVPALQQYIQTNLGEHFVTPIIPSMRALLSESQARTPVLLILAEGADPGMELQRLASQCGRDSGQYVSIALAQGLEKVVLSALQSAVRRGQWLVLLNCHLAPTVPALVWRHLETTQKLHPEFRLWLTADPSSHLPASLLQASIKVVLEIPKGLKLKLNNTFRKLEAEKIGKCKHIHFMRLLYVLTHFHAALQERVEYGHSGWNAQYSFTKCDYDTAIRLLKSCLDRVTGDYIPWKNIHFLIGNVVYGGHMSNRYDLRVAMTYLDEFCGDFIFQDKFRFYQDDMASYSIPPLLNTFGILAHIQSLPLGNSCVVLGLHSNAEMQHNVMAHDQLSRHMAQLQPQPVGRAIPRLPEDVALETLKKVLADLPPTIDTKELSKRYGSGGPILAFVYQELVAYNGLLIAVRQSLLSLEQGILGAAGMTQELCDLLESLVAEEVPRSWRLLCPPTNKKLDIWVQLLSKRHFQYYDWTMKHEPLVVWLPGLHSPRSFMLAVLQAASRAHHWALEDAGLSLVVESRTHLPAIRDGTYIKGLFLENASWDVNRGCLKQVEVGELAVPFPIISVTAREKKPNQLPCSLRTPLYATRHPQRGGVTEDPVWELDLPCTEHPSTWILQGARLLLEND